jgi:phosphatidylserine/phosphatidylglycerophosphate/cardiolipin synthase-like enzyme
MSPIRLKSSNITVTIFLVIIFLVAAYEAFAALNKQQPSAASQPEAATLPASTLLASTSAAVVQPTAAPASGNPASPEVFPAWLTVYFSNPNPPDNLGQGIDQNVLPLIQGATQTIDVATFDLNLPDVINALADAGKRGVRVRVVYDGTNGSLDLNNPATNNQPFDSLKILKAGKVKVVDGGRTSGLMHDKIIIIDGKVLFIGSWNLSYNDTYRNNNNLLKITNERLIANYQAKFNEMFTKKLFGAQSERKIPYPSISIDGVRVENYMAPKDGVMQRVVSIVASAEKSIHFMAFTYTHETMANAMIDRYKAGLDVQGVIETRGASQGSLVPLFCAGLPVKEDGNPYTMHHKVIIVDSNTVITGSFNFTGAADTANDDNVLIIHSPAVAALYEQEYQRISAAGVSPTAGEITCSK